MIFVDGVELIRQAIELADHSSEPLCFDDNDILKEYEWLFGEQTSSLKVPLLRVVHASLSTDNYTNQINFFFKPFNLKVSSTELCNWKDRRNELIPIGDLILFAFQLQTKVLTSRDITQLGHLPISPLERKKLTSVITRKTAVNSFQTVQTSYDPMLKLTPVSLIDESLPIKIETLELFNAMFPGVTLEKISFPICIKNVTYGPTITLPSSCTTQDQEISQVVLNQENKQIPSFRSKIIERYQLPSYSTYCPLINTIQLFHSSTLLRVEDNHFGETITQIFKKNGRRIISPEIPCSNSNTNEKRKETTQTFQLRKPTTAVNILKLSLYEYLRKEKMKAIIIVPTFLAQTMSFPILNFHNCKHFLEHKEILPCTKMQYDPNQSLASFSWKANLPWISRTGLRIFITHDFKFVDSSQVAKFSIKDWYRTLAVVVQGPEWQFSTWPFDSLTSLFSYIKPLYFAYESDTLPTLVQQHHIHTLRIKRTSRHGDTIAWNQFFQCLDDKLRQVRDFNLLSKSKLQNKNY
ncbi:uncharacterized protein LOC128883566 [Hylaeus volcanicus]|uniref:uncharacterized protein LOC128883566 n=1 Tax=Hylaeus volcanicus TaxID=313075 RepID=UPI0023B7951B|nr:uncharacterized protein LOC128883566 [Hylaeus volcanicus]